MRILPVLTSVVLGTAFLPSAAHAGLKTNASATWTYVVLRGGWYGAGTGGFRLTFTRGDINGWRWRDRRVIGQLPRLQAEHGLFHVVKVLRLRRAGVFLIVIDRRLPIRQRTRWTVELVHNKFAPRAPHELDLIERGTMATPEPLSMTLLATGLAGIGGFGARRRKKQNA